MGGCVALFITYLLWERILLRRKVQDIPLRICVTGTRGKSSLTRLISSSLRLAGFTVLSKTTGSKTVIIYPDGTEKEIKRPGLPTLREGKRLLKLAAQLKAQTLVTELMSIHPECLYAESLQIFKPQILAITNVRLDHIAQMGGSKGKIARSLACAIPEKGTVFVPQEECFPVFIERVMQLNSRLVQVRKDSYPALSGDVRIPGFAFEENIRLCLAVSDFLGIDRKIALRGMTKVNPDFGHLCIWSMDLGLPPRSWFLVNAFAANDPASTRLVLSRLENKGLFGRKERVGLLNLRGDRGDRTLQWLEAIKKETFPEFQKIFFMGDHASALKRRLKSLEETEVFVLKPESPQKIMEEISERVSGEAVLVGMGNMGGYGKGLVQYWKAVGKIHDI